ncbi:ig-like domain-containing protein [Caerostris darwini]|uniref:Ig-like domain-containing protein n=1 Tax=Caerostris darwini TaxID=1538125 RepID=A0AAV4QRX1_9ARAC|nr:ig-like domain-containing protein [Caerostris darwini]
MLRDFGKGRNTTTIRDKNTTQEIRTSFIFFSVPIQVRVTPPQQTISVGQATHFNCTVSGFPLYGVTWTKNLRPVVPNERIRVLSTDVLSISSVVRDDRGVYQCFAHNHFDSAQASGALLLGGILGFHFVIMERKINVLLTMDLN